MTKEAPSGDPFLDLQDAERLALRLLSLGPTSTFALKAAVMALETPGVDGTLTIKIPKNPKDYPDLHFQTGSMQ